MSLVVHSSLHTYGIVGRVGMLFLLVTITLPACAPLYVPSAPITPLFQRAGQVDLAGYMGINGFDAQVAASVSDGLALGIAGSFAAGDDDSLIYTRHRYGEVIAGWYGPFDAGGAVTGSLAILAGAGYGSAARSCVASYTPFKECDNVASSGDFQKYFLQAIGGISAKEGPDRDLCADRNEIGLTAKAAYLRFPNLLRTLYTIHSDTTHTFVGTSSETDVALFFFEPTLFARSSLGRVGGEFQIGYSFALASDVPFHRRGWHLSIGGRLRLGMMD